MLAGCASTSDSTENDTWFRNKSLDYTKSASSEPLQIPAGLKPLPATNHLLVPSAEGVSGILGVVQGPPPQFVFADFSNASVQVRGAGINKHLLISGERDQIWQRLLGYWNQQQIGLVESNQDTGIIETDWTPLAGLQEHESGLSSALRNITGGNHDPAASKVRMTLKAIDANTSKVSIAYTQATYGQLQAQDPNVWTVPERYRSEYSKLIADLLFYFNENPGVVRITDRKLDSESAFGFTYKGTPILRISLPMADALKRIQAVTVDWDVGSVDENLGYVYLTHTSNRRASKPLQEANGFWGWFRGLHTKSDSGPIVLSKSRDNAVLDENIVYSRRGVEPSSPVALADKKGYKFWLGGKVIYVIEDDDQGTLVEDGTYVYTARYILKLKASLSYTYVEVFSDDHGRPNDIYAEELLTQLEELL